MWSTLLLETFCVFPSFVLVGWSFVAFCAFFLLFWLLAPLCIHLVYSLGPLVPSFYEISCSAYPSKKKNSSSQAKSSFVFLLHRWAILCVNSESPFICNLLTLGRVELLGGW